MVMERPTVQPLQAKTIVRLGTGGLASRWRPVDGGPQGCIDPQILRKGFGLPGSGQGTRFRAPSTWERAGTWPTGQSEKLLAEELAAAATTRIYRHGRSHRLRSILHPTPPVDPPGVSQFPTLPQSRWDPFEKSTSDTISPFL